MRLFFGILIALLFVIPLGHAETSTTFCDLMQNPDKYRGKRVTVRATWRYGFEWSQFYCIDCSLKEMTWLEISPELDNASNKLLNRVPKGAGIVNITVEGNFESGGHFGHMDGYPCRFTAKRIMRLTVVSRGMKSSAEEAEAEKKWACGGSNPK
jgi:hypothetical protein